MAFREATEDFCPTGECLWFYTGIEGDVVRRRTEWCGPCRDLLNPFPAGEEAPAVEVVVRRIYTAEFRSAFILFDGRVVAAFPEDWVLDAVIAALRTGRAIEQHLGEGA